MKLTSLCQALILASVLLGGVCSLALAESMGVDDANTMGKQSTAAEAVVLTPYEQCVLNVVESGSNVLTASQLRNFCALSVRTGSGVNDSDSPARRRIELEQFAVNNPFSMLPHRPNYLLPLAFSSDPNPASQNDGDFQPIEVEFQLSLKVVILESVFRDVGSLSFGYTARSFWQAYNRPLSSPFRETNHEPELIFALGSHLEFGKFRNVGNALSVNHESNGRTGADSRSWNRVIFQTVWEQDRWAFALRPWVRIPAGEERYPGDPLGDDNPDILDYMGNFDLNIIYSGNTHRYSMMVRNNLHTSNNRGATELAWSFPVNDAMRGRLQYFHGYGENLIDYDRFNQTLGIGVELTGWL